MQAELIYLRNSLAIEDFTYYAEDEAQGNPYNTTFHIRVVSGCFSGIADCEYDIKEFRLFVSQLQELYNFKREKVELNDICYGSNVVFELNKTGRLEVGGTLYADGMQHSLTFHFEADQSVLMSFVEQLLKLICQENE